MRTLKSIRTSLKCVHFRRLLLLEQVVYGKLQHFRALDESAKLLLARQRPGDRQRGSTGRLYVGIFSLLATIETPR